MLNVKIRISFVLLSTTQCTNDLKNETNSKSFKNLIHSTMEAKYSEFTKKKLEIPFDQTISKAL